LTLFTGLVFYRTGTAGYLFSFACTVALATSLHAIIAYISPYFYELPTHHCPFCILQREYGFVGYPLYLALMAGAVAGLGVGATLPYRKIPSLNDVLPEFQRRLTLIAMVSFTLFLMISIHGMLTSSLSLKGP
jgi:hypothetical protein